MNAIDVDMNIADVAEAEEKGLRQGKGDMNYAGSGIAGMKTGTND